MISVKLIHNGLIKKVYKPDELKIEIFIRKIGIAEKSHKTRRDHCGYNVNHKSLF